MELHDITFYLELQSLGHPWDKSLIANPKAKLIGRSSSVGTTLESTMIESMKFILVQFQFISKLSPSSSLSLTGLALLPSSVQAQASVRLSLISTALPQLVITLLPGSQPPTRNSFKCDLKWKPKHSYKFF